MSNGNKIIVGLLVVSVIVFIILKIKQKQTPAYSLTDLFNQAKKTIGI